MKNWLLGIFAATSMVLLTGCSMCCGTYDYFYPAYGGLHERVDPEHGRVGSRFSDPNFGYAGASADSNLKPVEPKKSNRSDDDDDDFDMDDGLEPNNDILPDQLPGDELDRNRQPEPDDDTTATNQWRNRPVRSQSPNWR